MGRDLLKDFGSEVLKVIKDQDQFLELSPEKLQGAPILELYRALKQCQEELVVQVLAKLEKGQRDILLDLDLWEKDRLDISSFTFWPQVYKYCKDDSLLLEFAKSEQFLLYLKAMFTLSTFDVEDPQYPEDDNYFLSEDSLLLFQYEPNYPYVFEVKSLIRHVYYQDGVEKAYQFFFKLISDSFMQFEEREYEEKNKRGHDYGLVDYFEALGLLAPYPSIDFMKKAILPKKSEKMIEEKSIKDKDYKFCSDLSHQSKDQNFDSAFKGLISLEKDHWILEELRREDIETSHGEFFIFNLVKLVNAYLSLEEAQKSSLAKRREILQKFLQALNLGKSYLKANNGCDSLGQVLDFENCDFFKIYKVGQTLITTARKRIKKALYNYRFEKTEDEIFLGQFFENFLDNSFSNQVKVLLETEEKERFIQTYEDYLAWEKQIIFFENFLPYIASFHTSFKKLVSEQQIHSHLYLNYDLEGINFQSLILSSFVHFSLGHYEGDSHEKRLGVRVEDLKDFISLTHEKKSNGIFVIVRNTYLDEKISSFVSQYGLSNIPETKNYFFEILKSELSENPYDDLEEREFKHVGGPLIFNKQ